MSVFLKIISGEIPCYKVAETPDYLAFLDINPLHEGHTLVIPKKETDYIFDIDDAHYQGLWLFAKSVSKALKQAVPCKKVGIAVVGLEVPHAHIHLIPISTVSDMSFARPKLSFSETEFRDTLERIQRFI
jgi:histidine triad (HIT) family protein